MKTAYWTQHKSGALVTAGPAKSVACAVWQTDGGVAWLVVGKHTGDNIQQGYITGDFQPALEDAMDEAYNYALVLDSQRICYL